jgi:uncharacterized protein (TIGR00730 family)
MEAEQPALRSICVFCGSSSGSAPEHRDAAAKLGTAIARAGIRLIYGGGGRGLMGVVARAAISSGGRVTGIVPKFLMQQEKALRDVDDLIVTEDMHERKRLMFRNSDAFVALPGGIGTLEELLEQLSWAQLGQHTKPIMLVNVDHFWEPFINLIDHMRKQGFIHPERKARLFVEDDVLCVVPNLMTLPLSPRDASPDEGVNSKF